MRIAFVSTILGYPWGGADALWTSAAEVAEARGDRLLLAITESTARHARIDALAGRGATLFIRPGGGGPASLWKRAWGRCPLSARHPLRLAKRIRAFAPDLVILSCGGTYDPILEPALMDWLRKTGTPYRIIANFQQEHPALGEADRLRAREWLEAAERIFCVSPRNLEITRLHLLSPLPNAECIHGCMVHNPIPEKSDLSWPALLPWSFACIARLEPIKGIDLLLPALARTLGDVPDWRLNVYGRGPQRDYLEACARFCGIGDRVAFRGFVPTLADIWAQNHLLVSPAIDEGVPMTIPEAMLHGRAVLATRVGAADEWIEPGLTGFLCPAPMTDLLAGSLAEAWGQRQRWREMGMAAAARTRALYRPDDFKKIVA
jgi:glycosyltransferase involved in cell wall biosynthesis